MKFQRQIEEAIIKANNWTHYELDEAWEEKQDEILLKKYKEAFKTCLEDETTIEDIHKFRIFAENLPFGLIRVIGELYPDCKLG